MIGSLCIRLGQFPLWLPFLFSENKAFNEELQDVDVASVRIYREPSP